MTRRGGRRAALTTAFIACMAVAQPGAAEGLPLQREFVVATHAEVTVTINATCQGCDWSVPGREGAVLRLDVDGRYSQHVLLARGPADAEYSLLLGPLPPGSHTLTLARDTTVSAKDAGEVEIRRIDIRAISATAPEHAWTAEAPILHPRPGTLERFSDLPLAAYVESLPGGRGYRYTIIFSHEDGGTPTDRLMATWGRSTDIEFVYESERMPDGSVRQVYQGPGHEILPFRGTRIGSHPLLWVSTDNNMVSDAGPADAVRVALAPQLVDLTEVSRETFMDANPWLYAVMAAELAREGRIDRAALAGSGKIPDPLHFGYLEACGDLRDATLAFDVAVESAGETSWHATDRGDARFRIARSGCFRAAVPLPPGTSPRHIHAVRARAYTRPPRQGEMPLPAGSGRVTLTRLNTVFMLDEEFRPMPSGAKWVGSLSIPADGGPVVIPIR